MKKKLKSSGIDNICTLSKLNSNSPYLIAEKKEKDLLTSVKSSIQSEIKQIQEKRQAIAKLLAK